MKLYKEVALHQGLSPEQIISNGTWALYVDVACVDCGKEYAYSTVADGGCKCLRCGGHCK